MSIVSVSEPAPAVAAVDRPVYYHTCRKCAGKGKLRCPTCYGDGVQYRMGGLRKQPCATCGGEKGLRCGACAGVARFKISPMSQMLEGLTMEHSLAYYESVVERLQPALNGFIDTVNYHQFENMPPPSVRFIIDGTSTIELRQAMESGDGFEGSGKLQMAMAALRNSKTPRRARFIGRLTKIGLMDTQLGCNYTVQCAYLHLLEPNCA